LKSPNRGMLRFSLARNCTLLLQVRFTAAVLTIASPWSLSRTCIPR
jgi:hypothetical protein